VDNIRINRACHCSSVEDL